MTSDRGNGDGHHFSETSWPIPANDKCMARAPRHVFAGIPHHVTQRGNRRQQVFFTDEDRLRYLAALRRYADKFDVEVVAYCLMSNHLHQIVVPSQTTSLEKMYKPLHAQYAAEINKRFGWTGHLWQSRYYSSPLDEAHFIAAVRYTELNPVRADVTDNVREYPWSSARARITGCSDPVLRPNSRWNKLLPDRAQWSSFLRVTSSAEDEAIRRHTAQNVPTGSEEFVSQLERLSGAKLTYRMVGRPKKG